MCRLFGMTAAPHRDHATFWLLDAEDGLAVQSRGEPDGTGLGAFDRHGAPVVSKQPIAAYEDRAFARQARELASTTFVAHIRYASTGPAARDNTHPFEQQGRLLAHNGVIGNLARLERELGEHRALVHGDTDSERFFALVTRRIEQHGGDVTAGLIGGRAFRRRRASAVCAECRAGHCDGAVGAPLPGNPRALRPRSPRCPRDGAISTRRAPQARFASVRPMQRITRSSSSRANRWTRTRAGSRIALGRAPAR